MPRVRAVGIPAQICQVGAFGRRAYRRRSRWTIEKLVHYKKIARHEVQSPNPNNANADKMAAAEAYITFPVISAIVFLAESESPVSLPIIPRFTRKPSTEQAAAMNAPQAKHINAVENSCSFSKSISTDPRFPTKVSSAIAAAPFSSMADFTAVIANSCIARNISSNSASVALGFGLSAWSVGDFVMASFPRSPFDDPKCWRRRPSLPSFVWGNLCGNTSRYIMRNIINYSYL